MQKVALITGITGQDGSYLAELLLEKGYFVHGIRRRSSSFNTERINKIYQDPHITKMNLRLHYGDLTDSSNLTGIIQRTSPDEIYNLGAMSHVAVSFEQPEYVANVDGIGALRLLEAIRLLGMQSKTRYYQASTSEIFGNSKSKKQSETTPFNPRSPYGAAKLFAHWITINYREAHEIFACNGILFNHESPRRGGTFVSKKITSGLVSILKGRQQKLFLGNLDAKRDWGHARDYVEMQWLMLQQERPKDYVIATGIQKTVREFVRVAAEALGLRIEFKGQGVEEVGIVTGVSKDQGKELLNKVIVEVDPAYFRPTEIDSLLGDASLAKQELGWRPRTNFQTLVSEMISADLDGVLEHMPSTQN